MLILPSERKNSGQVWEKIALALFLIHPGEMARKGYHHAMFYALRFYPMVRKSDYCNSLQAFFFILSSLNQSSCQSEWVYISMHLYADSLIFFRLYLEPPLRLQRRR